MLEGVKHMHQSSVLLRGLTKAEIEMMLHMSQAYNHIEDNDLCRAAYQNINDTLLKIMNSESKYINKEDEECLVRASTLLQALMFRLNSK